MSLAQAGYCDRHRTARVLTGIARGAVLRLVRVERGLRAKWPDICIPPAGAKATVPQPATPSAIEADISRVMAPAAREYPVLRAAGIRGEGAAPAAADWALAPFYVLLTR